MRRAPLLYCVAGCVCYLGGVLLIPHVGCTGYMCLPRLSHFFFPVSNVLATTTATSDAVVGGLRRCPCPSHLLPSLHARRSTTHVTTYICTV
ncbi:hypothetical protein HDK90DRAFT_494131, partial [Phyllosticta capitalensis]